MIVNHIFHVAEVTVEDFQVRRLQIFVDGFLLADFHEIRFESLVASVTVLQRTKSQITKEVLALQLFFLWLWIRLNEPSNFLVSAS